MHITCENARETVAGNDLPDTILGASRTGFLVLNAALEALYHNTQILVLLGYSGDTPDPGWILNKLELKQPHFDSVARAVSKAGFWEGIYAQHDSILKVVVTPFMENAGLSFGCAGQYLVEVRDCTREMQQLQQLGEQSARAGEMEKMRHEIVAHISHEFKTPLNAILGYSEFVLADISLGDEHRDHLGEIVTASKKLLNNVNELLASTRSSGERLPINREIINLQEFTKECLTLLQVPARQQAIQFSTCVADTRIHTDRVRLKQALLVLLDNAVRHNRREGSVHLQARAVNGQLQVMVFDTGPGIAPGDQPHLFAPARRLAGTAKGTSKTGLGLLISHRLISLLDGTLHVVSRPGLGSLFWFDLPLNLPQIVEPAARQNPPLFTLVWVDNDPGAAASLAGLERLHARLVCRGIGNMAQLDASDLDPARTLIVSIRDEDSEPAAAICASWPEALKLHRIIDVNTDGTVENLTGEFPVQYRDIIGRNFSVRLLSKLIDEVSEHGNC